MSAPAAPAAPGLAPGDILMDCTGTKSLLRDHLVGGSNAEVEGANTVAFRI